MAMAAWSRCVTVPGAFAAKVADTSVFQVDLPLKAGAYSWSTRSFAAFDRKLHPEPVRLGDTSGGDKRSDPESTDLTPKNVEQVKKPLALGKELMKKGDVTKADVSRKMYELIRDETREVIVQEFVDGAGLTPKGAQTCFYNAKSKMATG